jgi:hypothetical protein
MKRLLFLSIMASLLAACGQEPTAASPSTGIRTPSLAAAAFTDNQSIPISLTVFIPCANGGSGEDVTLTGDLHVLSHVTISNTGNVTVTSHFQPQGIVGTGSVTGAKYQGTGGTLETFTLKAVGVTDAFANNFRMIGDGPGNNFLVHENIHLTVNANGTLTTFIDNFSVECK